MRPTKAHFVASGAGAVLLAFLPAAADFAQDNPATRPTFSSGYRFVEMAGEELFANVCQGCHMPDASGAAGAGAYPSLIANRNLATSSYAVHLVVNGRRGMPAFGDMMTDGQVAAVVNYLRTHFGNSYTDAVTAREVAEARR
ncbi:MULTISPECIES: c-type cytochrome [Bradyrhizobium]|uniref:c-type cytochrome n=1 Tax=Bradyrhizobium TaxID=374 RepID=UPI000428625E|nr:MULTISPECIES: cytochrome c [Bradyrhizobium]